MFEKFDNSWRKPRDAQKAALAWLEANWHKSNMFVLNLPTGVGKSAILRAIQEQFPHSHGLIPTNALLDDTYIAKYPDANVLKGLEHYKCSVIDGSCKDNRESGGKCTDECVSVQALTKAQEGHPTLFNPLSYYYNRIDGPHVIVVDEAHKLPEMLMLMVDSSFRVSDLGVTKAPESILEAVSLLDKLRVGVEGEIRDKKDAGAKKFSLVMRRLNSRRQSLLELTSAMREAPQDFVVYQEERKIYKRQEKYLVVKPIRCPASLLSACLNGRKIVMLSATIFKTDLEFMGYKDYLYYDSDSPINASQRPIFYRPTPVPFNYQSSPDLVAKWIKQALAAHGDINAIVHLSYAWQKKLAPYFPDSFVNSAGNKTETLKKFRETGGLWLAAGCAEGIDLQDDQCRLVIIPMIIKPNPTDPVVSKKLTLSGGYHMYDMDLVKQLVQQAGRAVRGEQDHAITIIGDHTFPQLVLRNKHSIPKSFLQAIKWSI